MNSFIFWSGVVFVIMTEILKKLTLHKVVKLRYIVRGQKYG